MTAHAYLIDDDDAIQWQGGSWFGFWHRHSLLGVLDSVARPAISEIHLLPTDYQIL